MAIRTTKWQCLAAQADRAMATRTGVGSYRPAATTTIHVRDLCRGDVIVTGAQRATVDHIVQSGRDRYLVTTTRGGFTGRMDHDGATRVEVDR